MIAAIYARKSTEQTGADADAKSVARQIDNAKEFAAAHGWQVAAGHIYADNAISGADTRKLVNRQRLLDTIGTGRAPFQLLVMRDASRFSRRDGDEAFGELKRLVQAGIEIYFYQDGTQFTFGNFGDNVVGFVRAEMAAEYRRQIAKWTREAMVRKAKAGHVTGGSVFGYTNVRVDGHVERRINEAEAAVVRRIFALSKAGTGYSRIAKQLNADQAPAPRPQRQRPAGWGPSTVNEILHRELYRGEVVWNKTKKRDAEGKTAQTARPESEWLRLERPELRIVSDDLWEAVHRRIETARATYDRQTHGRRQYRRDQDSKYLLTGFGRCAVCGGGLHVRSRSHGKRRVFFYACTAHYNKGPAVCPHVDLWPMEELDREVLAEIGGQVLTPARVETVVSAARELFEASAQPCHQDRLRRELAVVEREQARVADAIVSGGHIPVLMERLQRIEAKRRALLADLEQARQTRPAPSWRAIEGQVRQGFTDWRTRLLGDVADVREAFRRLLTGPIRVTPFVDEHGYRAVRFHGRIGLEAIFGGNLVTNLASPGGFGIDYQPEFRGIWTSTRRAA
jgi:site-specific DNA recombinase